MHIYETERTRYETLLRTESNTHNWLSGFRLLAIALAGAAAYQYYRVGSLWYAGAALGGLVLFAALVNWHQRVGRKKQFYRQLVLINTRELAALTGDCSAFGSGQEYVDPNHPYTFDLDIFGKDSFFQSINRTANRLGADRLARYFLQTSSKTDILETQGALRELAPRLEWRQHYLATGQLHADTEGAYQKLLDWAAQPVPPVSLALRIVYYLLPALTIASGACLFFWPESGFGAAFKFLAFLNLLVVGAHSGKIKTELGQLSAMYKIVEQYGFLIRFLEQAEFSAPRLARIKQALWVEGKPASTRIAELAAAIQRLESVQNIFGALFFNSLLLYHLHILLALWRWKRHYNGQIQSWIEATADMEALCSLAHFAFSNPDFVFPEISDVAELQLEGLGHPLIPAAKRVCNDIRFDQAGFVILTGSNMSGKSTFLRTIGINVLLAQTGAPVCATACRVFPFDIFVCMKLSDSLHDNESYFYAELKRLKRIIDRLEAGATGFVLLDEVLRGTNSNDKLTGTLGLVETMVRQRATGIIATHDLNVCDLTAQHPDFLRNMCFEVEMTADNLVFDYRLRAGVCVNKSASFLMRKMGVI